LRGWKRDTLPPAPPLASQLSPTRLEGMETEFAKIGEGGRDNCKNRRR